MPNIGLPEILVVLVIALMVFGPKRLPELGRSVGKGFREFKGAVGGDDDGDESESVRELQSSKAPVDVVTPVDGEIVTEHRG
jgi:sec-independent protein translocase protein TatA